MTWETGSPVKTRKYEYTYDGLSRLLRAKYTGLASENFSTSYSYDKHGNIMTLGRFGKKDAGTAAGSFVRVDSLQMAYNGNQLTRVTDKGVTVAITESEDFKDYANGSGQYTYNKNGALIKDTHKGILGISYNSLNLPRELAVKNSSVSGKNYYTYSASGVKLKTVHMGSTNLNYIPVFGSSSGDSNFNEVTTTEYIGNKVYENNVLKKILVEGGYYDVEKGKYFFYVQDHLGNNRLVADENGTVTQATHYYPFGQGFANSEGQDEQPYKYNGKEQDRRHGLNMYDYSARQMEPAIGRFTTVDPLAEKYYSISPYAYCANNPIKFIDPTGMSYRYNWDTGTYEDSDGHTVEWEIIEKYIQENENKDGDPPKKNEDKDPLFYISAIGDAAGGLSTGIGDIPGTFRVQGGDNNSKIFSPKYYASGFTGAGTTVKTYSISNASKIIGKTSIASTAVTGAVVIYDGMQKDGGTFGDNAQIATGGVVGGIIFSYIGAEIGMAAGNIAGSTVPGIGKTLSIAGGIIGSVAGGVFGVNVGERFVKDIKGIK